MKSKPTGPAAPRPSTFPGHEIFSEDEREAWHALLLKHLGPGEGRKALDLASGTGVISHLMDDLGFQVTGMDWSETMLALAGKKQKAGLATSAFCRRCRKYHGAG